MMSNEVDAANVYLNPQIRYEGYTGSDAYIRVQALQFPSVGFTVADVDLDGKNEVIVLEDHRIHIYVYQDGKLNQLAEQEFSYMINCLAVSVAKAVGEKCERCWIYSDELGSDPEHPTLCPRCAAVMKELA